MLRNAAHERSATVLVVSHDVRMIPLADQVFHMEDGRLVGPESPPLEVPRERRPHGQTEDVVPTLGE